MSAKTAISTGLLAASTLVVPVLGQSSSSKSPSQGVTSDLGGLVACANSVVDQNGSGCIQANVVPTLGMLYPLSVDLFVSAASGFVGLGTTNPLANLHVRGGGLFDLPGAAALELGNPNGDTSLTGFSNNGVSAELAFTDSGLSVRGNDGMEDLRLTTFGRLGLGTNAPISDFDVENRVWIAGNPFGLDEGVLMTRHANDLRAGYIGPFSSTQYAIGIHDNSGLFVTGGVLHDATLDETSLFADVKNFRETNPRNPETDIVYACIEGPEAAAYVRGTGELIGGRAYIALPEHFSDVAMTEGMTVQVTPRTAHSRGLAVIERTKTHFVVAELMNGQGSYEFDWEVKGVRAKFENYQVVRPKLRSPELQASPQQR